jgi:hypothetical protein
MRYSEILVHNDKSLDEQRNRSRSARTTTLQYDALLSKFKQHERGWSRQHAKTWTTKTYPRQAHYSGSTKGRCIKKQLHFRTYLERVRRRCMIDIRSGSNSQLCFSDGGLVSPEHHRFHPTLISLTSPDNTSPLPPLLQPTITTPAPLHHTTLHSIPVSSWQCKPQIYAAFMQLSFASLPRR